MQLVRKKTLLTKLHPNKTLLHQPDYYQKSSIMSHNFSNQDTNETLTGIIYNPKNLEFNGNYNKQLELVEDDDIYLLMNTSQQNLKKRWSISGLLHHNCPTINHYQTEELTKNTESEDPVKDTKNVPIILTISGKSRKSYQ